MLQGDPEDYRRRTGVWREGKDRVAPVIYAIIGVNTLEEEIDEKTIFQVCLFKIS